MSSTQALSALSSLPVISSLVAYVRAVDASRYRAIVLALIVVWMIQVLADIFWMLVPEPKTKPLSKFEVASGSSSSASSSSQSSQKADVAMMQSWSLFGDFEAEEVEAEIINDVPEDVDLDAKETRLNLKLMGVMQISAPNSGYAIIEAQSKSELYKVGDSIPVSRGVSLSKVLSDRVIIDNNGSFESLFLWDEAAQAPKRPTNVKAPEKKKARSSKGRSKRNIDLRGDKRITAKASEFKQKLVDDPSSLMNIMRVSPAKDSSGNVFGYRVSPGSDPELFKAVGLQSGDVVISINTMPVDNDNALQIYQDITTGTEATFEVQRGNEIVTILVAAE